MTPHPHPRPGDDWYRLLGLSPGASAQEIASAVERLSRQAVALAATDPERSQRLRDTVRSIKGDLLSGEDSRRAYDDARAPAGPPAWPGEASPRAPEPTREAAGAGPPGPGLRSRFLEFLRSGWTCPSCGQDMMPSDRFCGRCGASARPVTALDRAVAKCAGCGKALGGEDKFCTFCGMARG